MSGLIRLDTDRLSMLDFYISARTMNTSGSDRFWKFNGSENFGGSGITNQDFCRSERFRKFEGAGFPSDRDFQPKEGLAPRGKSPGYSRSLG